MAASLGWVRQFHKPASADLPPLLICPHAGAGASSYRAFSKVLSDRFDVVIFQYPGRQDRAREAALTELPQLAAGALAEFLVSEHHRGLPLTVFGHSMGAMVAFELVRAAEAEGVPVRLLGVSAAVSPGRAAELPPHPTEDEQILDHLGKLEGTGADVLASREVMRMALPVVKADYRAFDSYTCAPDIKVRAKIQVLGGVEDPFVTPRDLYGWANHSAQELEVTIFDGGHFYLNEHTAGVAELLAPSPRTAGVGAA
ncbi:thioesterase II family protein [Nocardia sp. CDC160]|uniref:thioesterase II family protein n=1 Tax=Nocardia sp. CDC160 TaxID=3112166 RepID=UPI002DB5D49E|nr:alpha/beta fold hydrolase [Nocardia sp. CDC160]MEC3913370.1 alpha/beta fold hydrolase [Nocardia sp. CDC160]